MKVKLAALILVPAIAGIGLNPFIGQWAAMVSAALILSGAIWIWRTK